MRADADKIAELSPLGFIEKNKLAGEELRGKPSF
jgi:hypothetical protein